MAHPQILWHSLKQWFSKQRNSFLICCLQPRNAHEMGNHRRKITKKLENHCTLIQIQFKNMSKFLPFWFLKPAPCISNMQFCFFHTTLISTFFFRKKNLFCLLEINFSNFHILWRHCVHYAKHFFMRLYILQSFEV